MPRIKELEDILKLVDAMPAEQQMECVKDMLRHVEHWEERQAFDGDDWEYLLACVQRLRERREARKRGGGH